MFLKERTCLITWRSLLNDQKKNKNQQSETMSDFYFQTKTTLKISSETKVVACQSSSKMIKLLTRKSVMSRNSQLLRDSDAEMIKAKGHRWLFKERIF